MYRVKINNKFLGGTFSSLFAIRAVYGIDFLIECKAIIINIDTGEIFNILHPDENTVIFVEKTI